HREMSFSVQLSSPHIVQVFEVSPPDAEVPFIAMERLRGSDLATRLRNELRLSLDELTELVQQVARGLDVAHAAGIVHRDLKPHNLFSHGDRWKILDFGVAKVMGSEGTLTEGAIIGTPNYMAPEQAAGLTVTHLADIYALGAIIYRCLTGRAPFSGDGKDIAGLIYQVVNLPPPRPSSHGSIPRGVEDVIAVAMAKLPQARFQSARELAEEFTAVQRRGYTTRSLPANAWSWGMH
ncbi:MAG TPA: serine/threonine-protein kinase, partial [Kofleriaceae bacterium]